MATLPAPSGATARHLAAGLVAVGMLAGCGTPEWTYVTNGEHKVYFKVPRSWQQVDQAGVNRVVGIDPDAPDAASQVRVWTVAFDAAAEPSADHLVARSLDEPLAFSQVLRIAEDDRDAVDGELMHNVFLPVTERARLRAAARGLELPGFEHLVDETVRPSAGVRGIHDVFRYTLGDVPETFDQTVYTTADRSRVFVLVVRCSTPCYEERRREVDAVVSSFTVEWSR